jgi:hypothetical protein
MGSCQSDEVIEIDSGMKNKASNQEDINPNAFGKTLNKDPDFPDMEEWPGERYKGIGIKRMKGYKCTLKIDELIKKREEFWKCKDEISETWNVINQACVYDVYRANMLLEKYNLKCVDGCINHIVDDRGNDYYIPNYCINDPYFEKELSEEEANQKFDVEVTILDVSAYKQYKIKVSNHATGEEVKDKFCKEAKIDKNKYKVRLFFSGSEILNDQRLYQYHIENGYKIQLMKTEI